MAGNEEIIELEIAEIDLYLINKVREIRVARGMSQLKLSLALGLAEGAIGKIENPKQRAKYNIRHINLLAKALHCNISDLLPQKPLKHDLVRVKMKIIKNKKDRRGEANYQILSKIPLEAE